MNIITQYVIYQIINNVNNDNKVQIKILYIGYSISDTENRFNTLKEIIPNIFMDTITNFDSKYSFIQFI